MLNIKKVIQITGQLLKYSAFISAAVEIIQFAHKTLSNLDAKPKTDNVAGSPIGV